MLNWKRVLVFGAHSDDEIIGLGGTIANLSGMGAIVNLVTFTTGDTAYTKLSQKGKMGKIRESEAEKAAKILGIKERINLGISCQGVVNCKEVYQECVRLIRGFRPEVIFTHYHQDKHRDHRAISEITDEARWQASESVLADLGKPWYTHELYYYEVLELFTFPSIVVDITDTFEKKISAMKTQVSQMDVLPGVLNYLEGLAKVRGYMRGTKYAEAFLASNFLPQRI